MIHLYNARYIRLIKIGKVLKFVEIIILAVFLTVIYLLFVGSGCKGDFCNETTFTENILFSLLSVSFLLIGILNSVRIALDFYILDEDPEIEYLFYTSLIGMAISYGLIGFFYREIAMVSLKRMAPNMFFYSQVLILVVSVVSFFTEPHIWKKANYNIKSRTLLSFIHIILLLTNPPFGVLSSVIITPIITLNTINFDKKYID